MSDGQDVAASRPGEVPLAQPRGRSLQSIALLLILVFAGALRLAGIDHGLARSGPQFDERNNFIDPILRMWDAGTLDPTVYSGYPGFFNYLAFVPVVAGRQVGGEVGAYVGARTLVACFGVLSVGLAYALARQWRGPKAGLCAAALLAVSPGAVRAAHYVTPDLVVGTAALGVLLLLRGREEEPRREVLASVVLGVATATKYTGLLIAPALVASALGRPRLVRRLVRLGLVATTTFVIAAPFAVFGSGGMGLLHSVQHYYAGAGPSATAPEIVQSSGAVFGMVREDLGWAGVLLALLAVVTHRPLRELFPGLAFAGVAIAVMAPAQLLYSRHAVPVSAVLSVMVGVGCARIHELLGRRGAALAAAGIAAIMLLEPASDTGRLVSRYLRADGVDGLAEWLETHERAAVRVVTSLDRLRLAERFEVRSGETLRDVPRRALHQYDWIVAARPDEVEALGGVEVVQRFASDSGGPSPLLLRASRKPALRLLDPPGVLTGSDESSALALAWDGRPDSAWQAVSGATWVEARWPHAVTVSRVDVEVTGVESWPQELLIEGVDLSGVREGLALYALRPTRPNRQSAPHGQVFVLEAPRTLKGIRITRPDGRAWGVAEIKVFGE